MSSGPVEKLLERYDKLLKAGRFSKFSTRNSSRLSLGRITIDAQTGINKSEIESFYQMLEKVRKKIVEEYKIVPSIHLILRKTKRKL